MRDIVSPLDGIRSPFGQRRTFTPLSLFSAGEVGAWYDPSDFSTMFQDAAGTTPVTAVEQPVGLIRDKSGRGNHASQTTSTSRPTLSARVNLLTYSEQFDNAVWSKSGSTVDANAIAAPNGELTADRLKDNSAGGTGVVGVTRHITIENASHTFSFYAKADGLSWVSLDISAFTGGSNGASYYDLANGVMGGINQLNGTITSVGNGWYRCTGTITPVSGDLTGTFGIYAADGNNDITVDRDGTSSIYIWGADLRPTNQTTTLPPYQRVGAATAGTSSAAGTGDYDTTGFPYYLKFDGTDDFLVTGTINPGSVDKAQVFAGVRKLSDAVAYGIVAELSASAGSGNKGSFIVAAPGSTTGTYFCGCIGSTNVSNTSSSCDLSTYTAPTTNVLAISFNVNTADRADQIIPRVNAVTPALSGGANSVQTGVFSSYPLYIGRRGGSTLPFNGRLYGLVVRFSAANLSDADIVKTETWLNARTGAY